MKNEVIISSNDSYTNLHVIEWIPEDVLGIVQISHGMVEFIDRYDRFAQYLNSKGYYVIGHDHLGHGSSVTEESKLGYFGEEGNRYLIKDIEKVRVYAKEKYPDVPYILLGHSMGSFLVRQYLTEYGGRVDKAIIMGTGYQSMGTLNSAIALCKVLKTFKGETYRSPFINNMALGSYNKAFEPGRTDVDWLTKDESIVDAYVANPLNNFVFTLNAYEHMFKGIKEAHKKSNINKIPKTLPLLIVSGENDPVGNFGKGVKKVYKTYIDAGIKDVTLKLYKDDRHEILNELDYEDVYNDIYEWIRKG